VDGEGEEPSIAREPEIGHVADIELVARRQLAQDQIAAARRISRRTPRTPRTRRTCRTRRTRRTRPTRRTWSERTMMCFPCRRLPREGIPPHPRVVAL